MLFYSWRIKTLCNMIRVAKNKKWAKTSVTVQKLLCKSGWWLVLGFTPASCESWMNHLRKSRATSESRIWTWTSPAKLERATFTPMPTRTIANLPCWYQYPFWYKRIISSRWMVSWITPTRYSSFLIYYSLKSPSIKPQSRNLWDSKMIDFFP